MPADVTLPQRPQVLGAEEQVGACELIHVELGYGVTEVGVIRGHFHGLQQGGVAAAGPCPETPVPGCDAGGLQPPLLCGVSHSQPRDRIQDRERKGAMDGEG